MISALAKNEPALPRLAVVLFLIPRSKNSTKKNFKTSELQRIANIPALILCGAADKLIPVEHSKAFNKILKNSQIQIVENTGHAPFAEKPAIVCEILREFLIS